MVLSLETSSVYVASLKRRIAFTSSAEKSLSGLDAADASRVRELCHVAISAKRLPAERAYVVPSPHGHGGPRSGGGGTGRAGVGKLAARLLNKCRPQQGMSFSTWQRDVLRGEFSIEEVLQLQKELEVDLATAISIHDSTQAQASSQEA